MLRFFKTRAFVRAMKKSGVGDLVLLKAAEELARGLHDGELGGGVFKKRVAIPGKGKRGSVRAIVATKAGSRWFFLFAYRKNERASLTEQEMEALKMLARDLTSLPDDKLKLAVQDGALSEIGNGEA